MMEDPLLAQDEEELTATMIRFVEEPDDRTKQARKVRVPLQLLTLLRSPVPMQEKRSTLDRLVIRLMEEEEFEHPTLTIVDEDEPHPEKQPEEEMFHEIEGQSGATHSRIPRGRLESGQRFQFPDRLQTDQVKTLPQRTARPSAQLKKKKAGPKRKGPKGSKKPKKQKQKRPSSKRVSSTATRPPPPPPPATIRPATTAPRQAPTPPPAPKFDIVTRQELSNLPPSKGSSKRRPKQNSRRVNGPDNNFGFPFSFGEAGVDFPMYDQNDLPQTGFSCSERVNGGFYADTEARCQMYHMCVADPGGSNVRVSFLCPNGTLFSQETLSCGMWHAVDCRDSTVSLLSQLNDALEAERDFITLGLEASDPNQDFPWRNRDQDTSGF